MGQAPTHPAEEVAYFIELKVNQLRRRDITNWTGMLLQAVPAYFSDDKAELTRYRAEKAQEQAEQPRQAQMILDDRTLRPTNKTWLGLFWLAYRHDHRGLQCPQRTKSPTEPSC